MSLMTAVSRGLTNTGLVLKKHSPEILIATGVVGVVGSTILACRATRKVDDILDEHHEVMDEIREVIEDEQELKKATTMRYAQTAMSLAKLYAPAIALGVVSLGAIISSNQILRKRNAALIASYAVLDKGFKEYRKRVVDRVGDEVEKQIFYGMKPEEVEETVTDAKGNEKTVKKTVKVSNPDLVSPYTKFFTRMNPHWKNDEDHNKTFLSMRQSYLNDILKAKGFLTLNEAFRECGFEETDVGMVCGWIYDPQNPTGDNAVKITIDETYIPNDLGGKEKVLACDFNVDGNIYELMQQRKGLGFFRNR